MSQYKNIIIVGTNNTSRSFMIEVVFQKLFAEYQMDDVKVISRGLVVLFPEPVHPKAAEVLREAGYEIRDFQAGKLKEEEAAKADLIITVTVDEKEHLLADYQGALKADTAVMTLSEFAKEQVGIPNPYGKEKEDYIHCFIAIKRMVEKSFDNHFLKK